VPVLLVFADSFAGSLVHSRARHRVRVVSRAAARQDHTLQQRMGGRFRGSPSFGPTSTTTFGVTLDAEHTVYNYRPSPPSRAAAA